ncbi:MAG: beta-ketoacyl-ACP synthase [Myxococcota bacterium]
MSRPPCRLAALGQVSALGRRRADVFARLIAGDGSRLTLRDDFVPERSLWLGQVREPLPEIPERLARFACRNNQLALAALESIGPEIAAALARFGAARIGVVVGTSTSGVGDAEAAIAQREKTGALAREFFYDQLEFGGLARFVAEAVGARGPAYTLSTACSSGARALASARSLVALGICDAVVSGAADSLCGLTTNGFASLGALGAGVTNPCSVNRDGLTLGEAGALFLVTGEPGGVQLLGVGDSSEAHHMSAPDPDGRGAEVAMRGALADAGLAPGEIAYLNLHGTGTPQNDVMEAAAVARVLGTELPCSSTKPLVGHTLGAAGAIEAAFCWLLLAERRDGALALPPHVWDGARDPALAPIRLAAKGESARIGSRALVMSNSFGFGGNNCTLILGASDSP